MSGDLLFWTGDGSPAGRLISWTTRGPFVHVSVDLGDGTDLGAHSDGSVQVCLLPPNRRDITTYSLPPEARVLLRGGLAFLYGEAGNTYGWRNVFNAGWKSAHPGDRSTSPLIWHGFSSTIGAEERDL